MLALGRRCSWLGFKPFPNAWGVAVWVKVEDEVTVVKRLNSCALTKALLYFIQIKAEVKFEFRLVQILRAAQGLSWVEFGCEDLMLAYTLEVGELLKTTLALILNGVP